MDRPDRKHNRLENYDYSSNGLYFITICTKNREKYLSDIISVWNAALGVPQNTVKNPVGNAVPYKCGHSVIDINIEEICKKNRFQYMAAFLPRPYDPQ